MYDNYLNVNYFVEEHKTFFVEVQINIETLFQVEINK